MSAFVILSWIICTATSAVIASFFAYKRWLFVKPSVVVITAFHICIQWAATIDAPEIETYLPVPWHFFAAAQLFPFISLLFSSVIFPGSALRIWRRITNPSSDSKNSGLPIIMLTALVATVVLAFLREVPLSQTGLYSVIYNPEASVEARERSLKNLDSAFLRYAFSFMVSSFGPLLAAAVAARFISFKGTSRFVCALGAVPAMGGVLLAVSLSGARSFAAAIVLILASVWILRRGIPIRPVHAALFGVLGLSFPVVFSLAREGADFSLVNFWTYLVGPIANRVFHMPMETGLYYTHYAQTIGFMGAGANERLSSLFGMEYFNAPHELGLIYYPQWASDALHMNTCYVFAYYACFGLGTIPLSILAVLFLDVGCVVLAKISDRMLLPACATVLVACLSLISVEYTTALLTNGIIVTLFLAYCLDQFCRLRFKSTKYNHDRMPVDVGSSST